MSKKSENQLTKPNPKKKGSRGPPAWNPDLEKLRSMGALQLTMVEIAAFYEVTVNTVYKEAARNPEFKELITSSRARGVISIKRIQYQLAMAGDKTMLIWWGKQYCGQKNVLEVEEKPKENPLERFRTEAKIIDISSG